MGACECGCCRYVGVCCCQRVYSARHTDNGHHRYSAREHNNTRTHNVQRQRPLVVRCGLCLRWICCNFSCIQFQSRDNVLISVLNFLVGFWFGFGIGFSHSKTFSIYLSITSMCYRIWLNWWTHVLEWTDNTFVFTSSLTWQMSLTSMTRLPPQLVNEIEKKRRSSSETIINSILMSQWVIECNYWNCKAVLWLHEIASDSQIVCRFNFYVLYDFH